MGATRTPAAAAAAPSAAAARSSVRVERRSLAQRPGEASRAVPPPVQSPTVQSPVCTALDIGGRPACAVLAMWGATGGRNPPSDEREERAGAFHRCRPAERGGSRFLAMIELRLRGKHTSWLARRVFGRPRAGRRRRDSKRVGRLRPDDPGRRRRGGRVRLAMAIEVTEAPVQNVVRHRHDARLGRAHERRACPPKRSVATGARTYSLGSPARTRRPSTPST